MAPPGEGEERSLNEAVRKAVARAITGQNPAFESCAAALAFAAHPWPNQTVPQSVLEVIATEMSTSRTLPHHDPRELGQDRLLRIAEGLDELLVAYSGLGGSCGDLPSLFRKLAGVLDLDIQNSPLTGSNSGTENQKLVSSLIGNTTGLNPGPPTPGAGSTIHAVGDDTEAGPVLTGEEALGFASALVAAYVRTGCDDLSELLGGSQTGGSVMRFVESFQLGPYLLPAHDEFLQTLSDRNATILSQRLAFPGERRIPFREIGEQQNVTGEAVRRVEARTLNGLDALTRRNSGVFDQVAHQVHPTERLVAAAKVLTAGSANRELLAKLLLKFEADWARDGDYSIGDQVADQFASPKARLAEHADENLLLTEEAVAAAVGDLFSSESTRDTFLRKSGLIQIHGFWALRDNQQTRIAAALRTIGRPATKAEIGELAGLTESQVSSNASAMPNVVRAGITRWGFAEWVADVYDGIVGGIEQRLDENDGEVRYDSLLAELEQFDLKEASIKAYVQCDAYLWEDGVVRRNPAAYKPRLLANRDDVVWDNELCDDELCGQRIVLAENNFKGFSLLIGFDVAYENGLRPNADLIVPFEGVVGSEVSVIWRPTTVTRNVDVGRVAQPLEAAGFSSGDTVLVFVTPDWVRVVADPDPSHSAGERAPDGIDDLIDILGGRPE